MVNEIGDQIHMLGLGTLVEGIVEHELLIHNNPINYKNVPT